MQDGNATRHYLRVNPLESDRDPTLELVGQRFIDNVRV